MKRFIKKLSLFAMFGLMMSSYGFAHGGHGSTQVTVNFPDSSFVFHEEKKTCSGNTRNTSCDWTETIHDDGTYTIDPKRGKSRYWVSHNDKTIDSSILENKNFAGSGYWNWTFDKDDNHTRDGLDIDKNGKVGAVLYREVNGVLQYNVR